MLSRVFKLLFVQIYSIIFIWRHCKDEAKQAVFSMFDFGFSIFAEEKSATQTKKRCAMYEEDAVSERVCQNLC